MVPYPPALVNMVSLMQSSNFGWSVREGLHDLDPEGGCYENESAYDARYTDPITEYDHNNGNCSIIGGYWMDWGPEIFRDSYMYGDFCTGQIWKISQDNDTWVVTDVVNTRYDDCRFRKRNRRGIANIQLGRSDIQIE